MPRTRYPHAAAGKFAAIPFAVCGLAAGWLVSTLLPGAPPPVVNALIWGFLGAIGGYIVFASEGAQRPVSVLQASVADGVVGGIGIGISGTVIDLFAASGLGGSTTHAPGGSTVLLSLVAGAVGGAVVGAALGYLIFLVGGESRLGRVAPRAKKKTVQRSSQRRNRR